MKYDTLALALFFNLRLRSVVAGEPLLERVDGFVRLGPYANVTLPRFESGGDELVQLELRAREDYDRRIQLIREIRESLGGLEKDLRPLEANET